MLRAMSDYETAHTEDLTPRKKRPPSLSTQDQKTTLEGQTCPAAFTSTGPQSLQWNLPTSRYVRLHPALRPARPLLPRTRPGNHRVLLTPRPPKNGEIWANREASCVEVSFGRRRFLRTIIDAFVCFKTLISSIRRPQRPSGSCEIDRFVVIWLTFRSSPKTMGTSGDRVGPVGRRLCSKTRFPSAGDVY